MSEPGPPPTRIFVVGCPRSGTTLLQSMLAAHPEVLAFRETHAFWGLQNTNPGLRRAGVRSRASATTWRQLPDLGVPVVGAAPLRVGSYVRGVVSALDDAATAAGRRAWSEKTPGHLRSLNLVQKYIPGAHVVHVVRQGVPAVRSLFAVTKEHGEAWSGERSLDLCVKRWCNDLRRTAACAGLPGQVVVSYEALVEEPHRVLAALLVALDLGQEVERSVASMMAGYQEAARAVRGPGEHWKGGVDGPLAERNAAREDLLQTAEAARVAARVAEFQGVYAGLAFL